ncbi:hypothetical protein M2158_008615 [Streptomyces sp. SAI-144]|uniref:hypothetical protein n=1 Tax=unclassified Streptomyces TaxID=2593676 RepID=UPI002474A454|nr:MULTISPECIES: hypothetical protein [unclassified Streptomyces]MDH6440074.1 hypothetical protein [Streptomyces sp. SAI-144]MDH6487388.1 hypothetical protein [Streptomyces sp. SAI-127]
MDSDEHVCPVCGQPVQTVVRRHKTLGAWVPVWVGGPCHNPECEANPDRVTEPHKATEPHKVTEPDKVTESGEDHGGAPAGKSS